MVREFLEKVLLSLLLPKPDFRLLRPKNLDFLKRLYRHRCRGKLFCRRYHHMERLH